MFNNNNDAVQQQCLTTMFNHDNNNNNAQQQCSTTMFNYDNNNNSNVPFFYVINVVLRNKELKKGY